MTTRLEIIRNAQRRIGDEPISTEHDAGADTHVGIFDAVRDDLLSRYPWSFATVTRRLARLTAVPAAHWSYYYQLPVDMLGAPRGVYVGADCHQPFTGFELTENRLATNAEEVWLEYLKRAEITIWPGYFVELVTMAVMAEFALSIREERALYNALQEACYGPPSMLGEGGRLGIAKGIDAQSKPSLVVAEGVNILVDVRT